MSTQHRPIGCNIRTTPGGFVSKRKATAFQPESVNQAAAAFLAKRGLLGFASAFERQQANVRHAR